MNNHLQALSFLLSQNRIDDMKKYIKELLKEGRASEAEDLLFENEDSSDMVNFEIALWFYNELNMMEDKKLAEMDFTRAEIRDGLRDLLMLYGFEEYAKNIK